MAYVKPSSSACLDHSLYVDLVSLLQVNVSAALRLVYIFLILYMSLVLDTAYVVFSTDRSVCNKLLAPILILINVLSNQFNNSRDIDCPTNFFMVAFAGPPR